MALPQVAKQQHQLLLQVLKCLLSCTRIESCCKAQTLLPNMQASCASCFGSSLSPFDAALAHLLALLVLLWLISWPFRCCFGSSLGPSGAALAHLLALLVLLWQSQPQSCCVASQARAKRKCPLFLWIVGKLY